MRAFSSYNEDAASELRRLQTEADFSSQETINAYGNFLKERQAALLNDYSGDPDSRVALQERLEGVRMAFADRAAVAGSEAQRALVTDTLNGEINKYASYAQQDPASLNEWMVAADAAINDAAAALPPDQERAFRQQAQSQMVLGAVDTLLANGDVDGASAALGQPEVAARLPQSTRFKLRARIISQQAQQHQTDQAAFNAIRKAEAIVGRELTGAERLRLAGLKPDQGRVTALQKVQEAEDALGRKLNETEREAIIGLSGDGEQTFSEKVTEIETGLGRQLTDEEKTRLAGANVPVANKSLSDEAADAEALLGRPLTDAEKKEIAGFGGMGSDIPSSIAAMEQALERPLTEEEIARIGKIDGGSGFGKSLTGLALNRVTEDAPAYAAGLLEPGEERRFEAAINQYMQERTITDPDTGQVTRIRPTLPPFAQDALDQRGMVFDAERGLVPVGGSQPQRGVTREGRPIVQNSDGSVSTERTITVKTPDGAWVNIPTMYGGEQVSEQEAYRRAQEAGWKDAETGRAFNQFPTVDDAVSSARARSNQLGQQIDRQRNGEMPPPSLPDNNQTVFEMSGVLAGPGPFVGRTLSRTPGLGTVARAPQMNSAAQYVTGLQQQLVNALRQNPRFTEGERQAIAQETNIEPSALDTQGAFIDRLRGIDLAIDARMQDAAKVLAQDPTETTVELRQSAMQTITLLGSFQERLGVPPTVQTPEQAKQLPPDQEFFFTPDGTMYRNPNFGQSQQEGAQDGE